MTEYLSPTSFSHITPFQCPAQVSALQGNLSAFQSSVGVLEQKLANAEERAAMTEAFAKSQAETVRRLQQQLASAGGAPVRRTRLDLSQGDTQTTLEYPDLKFEV